ncbi:MAG: hypothetical protein QM741_18035 [Rudaea sp.]|uniref:hypothetical protein n=1 Tax=Rudaea sp. TaxID=2136325 RepID=UPI0039E271E6
MQQFGMRALGDDAAGGLVESVIERDENLDRIAMVPHAAEFNPSNRAVQLPRQRDRDRKRS